MNNFLMFIDGVISLIVLFFIDKTTVGATERNSALVVISRLKTAVKSAAIE